MRCRCVATSVQSNPADAQQSGNRVAEVAGHVGAAPDEPRHQAVVGGRVAADVDQVQPAARTQHPKYLCRGGRLRVVV